MMIDIFGSIQYVHELNNSVDVISDRLYVFLKQSTRDGKAYYEYLGSMLSTKEDDSISFMSTFLDIATHYALLALPQSELLSLKQELDSNDRRLVFEGIASV